MWRFTLKALLAHRVRLLLTTLSVVLGVAFVAGTFVLTDTMNRVFDDLVRGGANTVDVLVRAERPVSDRAIENLDGALPPLPAALADDVRAVDGVTDVEGGVEGFAMIVRPDGRAITPMGPPTLGASYSPTGDRVLRTGGRAPSTPHEVAIDGTTADRNDLTVGDRVGIVFAETPPREFTIVGVTTKEAGENLAGATLAEFSLPTAQEVLGLEGSYSSINVWGRDGLDLDELAARIDAALPAGVEAITAEAWADEMMGEIGQALGFFTILFGVFAAVAVLVGAFIIANTFSVTVLQRTREFALLRALGASRRQVVWSVVGEGLVIGLLASALGIVVGLGLAVGLNTLLRWFGVDMPSGTLVLAPRTIVAALAVGTGVTVLSSLLPARRAAGTHPLAALRAASLQAYRPSRRRLVLGTVAGLGAAALLLVAATGAGEGSAALLGGSIVLALVALASAGPALTRPIVRLFGGSGSRLGASGHLARSNTLRTPRRTWATASALMIGLLTVSGVAVIADSMKASVASALDATLRADVIVMAANPMTGGTVPPVVGRELATLPEVGAASPYRVGSGTVDGRSATVVAVDPHDWPAVSTTLVDEGALADLAAPATLAVDTETAAAHGYGLHDRIAATFPLSGATELEIVALFEPDELVSGWLLSTDTHATLFSQPSDTAVLLGVAEAVTPDELLAAVDAAVAAYPAVVVQDQTAYRETVAGQVDQQLALVTALLAMALFIAVLGIMNTLALSIHERVHEIGLLRAVGMTRRQVRRMVRWEAVTVALLGAVVGVTLGVVFGWATTRVLADEGLDVFALPVGQLGGALVLAALAGLVAAALPARRAARLDVLRAVTAE